MLRHVLAIDEQRLAPIMKRVLTATSAIVEAKELQYVNLEPLVEAILEQDDHYIVMWLAAHGVNTQTFLEWVSKRKRQE